MKLKQVLTLKEAREIVPRAIAQGIPVEKLAERYRLKNGGLVIDTTVSTRNGQVRRETVSIKTESVAAKAASKAKTWQGKASINGKAGFLKISAKGLTFNGKPVDISSPVALKAPKEAFEVAEKTGFKLATPTPTPTPTPSVRSPRTKKTAV